MTHKRSPEQFKQIIGGSLPGGLSRRLPDQRLSRAWQDLVGQAVAAKTRPVALEKGGALVVAVKGTIWRQELSYQAPELIRRLQEGGHNIARIKLVLDRTRPKAPPPPPPLPKLDDKEEAEVQACVASVKDPRLRKALAGVRRAQMRARKAGHI
jgi:hypothetical protein